MKKYEKTVSRTIVNHMFRRLSTGTDKEGDANKEGGRVVKQTVFEVHLETSLILSQFTPKVLALSFM